MGTRPSGSNVHPQSMLEKKNKKIIKYFQFFMAIKIAVYCMCKFFVIYKTSLTGHSNRSFWFTLNVFERKQKTTDTIEEL